MMKTSRWTLHESLQIIHQLLQIVVYLQSLQPSILHRDIKPSNILISHQDGVRSVYLIDFGTAIDAIHRTLGATHNAGTIGYMAPEQIVGNPEEASDVYSVGCCRLGTIDSATCQRSFDWYVITMAS